MRTVPPLDTDAHSLAFHPVTGALATASWNGLFLWDPVSGRQSLHAWLALDRSGTTPLAFSPDGRWALLDYHLIDVTEVVGEDAFPPSPWYPPGLRRRPPAGGNVFLRRHPLVGLHRSAHLAFSGDGRRLIGVGSSEVAIWDMPAAHRQPVRPFSPPPIECRSLALTPDGRFFAVVEGARGNLVVWVVESGGSVRLLRHPTTTHRVLFSPDGRSLAVGLGGGQVQNWDVSNLDGPGSSKPVTRLTTEYQPRRGAVYALAFSPDGRFLAAGNASGAVHLWETGTWHEAAALDWQVGAIRSLAFSPDGMTAACAGDAGRVIVWDVDA